MKAYAKHDTNMCHLFRKKDWRFRSSDHKVFLWQRLSNKPKDVKKKRQAGGERDWKDCASASSCNAMLIPRRDHRFLFYVSVVHTARSDSACVSSSPSDRWLPDITRSVRLPLILNITAPLTLSISPPSKPRYSFSPIEHVQLCDYMFGSENESAGEYGAGNLDPRGVFVFSKRLGLLTLKRALQNRALGGNIWPLSHRR